MGNTVTYNSRNIIRVVTEGKLDVWNMLHAWEKYEMLT